ncbi:3-keto-disaccharide hydrolase [Streptomyces dysideae]|uniref:3-keto-disaccharide hydrolase n=1 Tax=Streptomyces dysideae TaxID=909626 RepID=UPI000AD3475C|nr:DUF1080 domain-containing protein [Streptomyces dysideae]
MSLTDAFRDALASLDRAFLDDVAHGWARSALPGGQSYQRPAPLAAGQWTDCEIEVRGDTYTVRLNGAQTTVFTNTDTWRGKPANADPASGFIGLQAHTGKVGFRNIRIKEL